MVDFKKLNERSKREREGLKDPENVRLVYRALTDLVYSFKLNKDWYTQSCLENANYAIKKVRGE